MQSTGRSVATVRAFPKLYNAKRQVKVSRGLLPEQLDFFRKNPLSETWKTQVSEDVVDFVETVEGRDDKGRLENELLPQEKIRLFQNPAKYFSRPHNVPESARKQIYFPDFGITLLRSTHLGPYYAQFKVPLYFNKLDLKSYLKNLYNVEVNHIRSFVIHRKESRQNAPNKYHRGTKFQPTFSKKMTVELVEPFVWPAEPTEKDLNDDDNAKDKYWKSTQALLDSKRQEEAQFASKPDQKHRRSMAEQAKALLAGKTTWQPTWQQLPQDVRVLGGKGKSAGALSSHSPSPLR